MEILPEPHGQDRLHSVILVGDEHGQDHRASNVQGNDLPRAPRVLRAAPGGREQQGAEPLALKS